MKYQTHSISQQQVPLLQSFSLGKHAWSAFRSPGAWQFQVMQTPQSPTSRFIQIGTRNPSYKKTLSKVHKITQQFLIPECGIRGYFTNNGHTNPQHHSLPFPTHVLPPPQHNRPGPHRHATRLSASRRLPRIVWLLYHALQRFNPALGLAPIHLPESRLPCGAYARRTRGASSDSKQQRGA